KYLVNRDLGIIQLFNPPFDKSSLNPGYIKGYVPGVRENGGQYTHAAIWLVMAYAALGEREKTWELVKLINPVNHGSSQEAIQQYKVEPYVIAADVYGVEGHKGRGGWTWYTGSAGWMYQLLVEWFIGLKKKGNELWFEPCLPPDWPSVKVLYRYMDTFYQIELIQNNVHGQESWMEVNGRRQDSTVLTLDNDGGNHEVRIHVEAKQEVVEKG